MRCKQNCQHKGANHLNVLRGKQHLFPVKPIGKHAAHKRKEHEWKLAKEEIKPKVEGVFGEVVNEPALGKLLDKGSDGGNASTDPHDPEIAVSKRSEDAIEEGHRFGHWTIDPARLGSNLS